MPPEGPAAFSLAQWAVLMQLGPDQVDCAIAVMLKVLDGKCKMPVHEAAIMIDVYDVVRDQPTRHLGEAEHAMIDQARGEGVERFRAEVYEARVLAETRISRPVMKAFKAHLRQEGILPPKNTEG